MKAKAVNVMRLPPGQYRTYHFPPVVASHTEGHFTDEQPDSQIPQIALQQRLEDGFQQGIQQGYDEGFRQGIEQGKLQGGHEGHKEGFLKGLTEGASEGKQSFVDAARPVHDLLEKLMLWQNNKEREHREQICELVQKVAQRVIRAELTLVPQQILALIDETLDSLPGKAEHVVVHLNPDDLNRITQINSDLPPAWRLVPDSQLPIGGCQLVTEFAEADVGCDARLETCMQNVREHLLNDAKPSFPSEPDRSAPFLDVNTEVDGE